MLMINSYLLFFCFGLPLLLILLGCIKIDYENLPKPFNLHRNILTDYDSDSESESVNKIEAITDKVSREDYESSSGSNSDSDSYIPQIMCQSIRKRTIYIDENLD